MRARHPPTEAFCRDAPQVHGRAVGMASVVGDLIFPFRRRMLAATPLELTPPPPRLLRPLRFVCREYWNTVKVRIENEVHRLVVNRDRKYTNFVEVRGEERDEGVEGRAGQRQGGDGGLWRGISWDEIRRRREAEEGRKKNQGKRKSAGGFGRRWNQHGRRKQRERAR